MLNSLIKNFLSAHTRLVVPDFGVFIRKEDTGEVIFSQLLKKDDDVLTTLVMAQFSVEKSIAREMINKYVSQIKQQSLVSGSYTMPDFGELMLTDNGNFVFKSPQWAVLESLELNPKIALEDIEQVSFPENTTLEDTQEQTQQQDHNYDAPVASQGKDKILIIAVIAAIIAILAMAYGLMFSVPKDVDLTPQLNPQPQTEQSITE